MTNVKKAIEDLKEGKLIVVLDDMERENEGDLIGLPEFMSADSVNFMIKHGRGLLCAPMSKKLALRHELKYMPKGKSDGTNFLISIDSPDSTTGISAFERMKTLEDLLSENKIEFMTPGHMYPLLAVDGGLSERRGHTEAGVDLAKLAGSKEVAAIIEIIKDDGEMGRRDFLIDFANTNNLTFITIEDLVQYIKENNNEIWKKETVKEFKLSNKTIVPTEYGDIFMQVAKDILNDEDYIMVFNEDNNYGSGTMRIHSQCVTSEIFKSKKCDCKNQLDNALKTISKDGGMIIYTPDEGRGIGIFDKINAYSFQEKMGLDTVEANLKIGKKPEERNFSRVANLVKQLEFKKVKLMTNNPDKIKSLTSLGIEVQRKVHWTEIPSEAEEYIEVKKTKMGHEV